MFLVWRLDTRHTRGFSWLRKLFAVANDRFDKQCLTTSYRMTSGRLRSLDCIHDENIVIVASAVEEKMVIDRRPDQDLASLGLGLYF